MMILTEISWQQSIEFPLLSVLQALPFLAVILLSLVKNSKLVKTITFGVLLGELALAIYLYYILDAHSAALQFAEYWPLLPGYHAAVDGISVLYILLATFLCALLFVYALIMNLRHLRVLFMTLLASEAVLLTLLTTMNLLWFNVFSIIELLLVAFLMSHWSDSAEEDVARARYLQFMLIGILMFIAGVMILGWNHADNVGVWDFDLFNLTKTAIDPRLQTIVFFLLFYGLAIKVPLFPMHGWWPVMVSHGSLAVAPVILIGIKIGIYGMLRFVFPLTPDAISYWQPYIVTFAVVGVFYAAMLTFMQKNIRSLLAFAVISHTSILTIGLFSLGHTAFQGSVLLSVNFGLAVAGLLMVSGFVLRRTNSLLMIKLGGLFDTIPLLGITFLISGLAIIGMPGTPGFDAVHLVLEAAIERFGALVTIITALGNVIAAGFLLLAFQRTFLTPSIKPLSAKAAQKITVLERIVALILIFTITLIGFHLDPWLDLIEVPLDSLHELYNE